MTQTEKSLDRLYISSPCDADWEKMPGSETVRFCSQCSLNVYNISGLTKKQAEKLIAETEGRPLRQTLSSRGRNNHYA